MTVAAIIQARLGSERLPGKVLADVAGRPLLEQLLLRLDGMQRVDTMIVATTTLAADDAIVELAHRLEIDCFRGASEDVLDRYYQAARGAGAAHVVRLTADNPFVEGSFVDWVLANYEDVDYADTWASNTFPVGMAVEAFSFAALEQACREGRDPASREHVTPFIHDQPDRFRLRHLAHARNLSDVRITIDEPPDLELARRVFRHFGDVRFSWLDAVSLIRAKPELLALNSHVRHRT